MEVFIDTSDTLSLAHSLAPSLRCTVRVLRAFCLFHISFSILLVFMVTVCVWSENWEQLGGGHTIHNSQASKQKKKNQTDMRVCERGCVVYVSNIWNENSVHSLWVYRCYALCLKPRAVSYVVCLCRPAHKTKVTQPITKQFTIIFFQSRKYS